jgi:DNA-binding MarR family transcriptional regulator
VLTLEQSAVDGYDEWVALNTLDGTHASADAVDEIARVLATGRAVAGRALDTLVGKGLVTVDREGARLTASGRALLTDLRAMVGKATHRLVDGLDDAELTTTLHVLDHLRDAARAMTNPT